MKMKMGEKFWLRFNDFWGGATTNQCRKEPLELDWIERIWGLDVRNWYREKVVPALAEGQE